MARRLARLLTDEQWSVLEPLLPEPKRRKDGRGRPWRSNRECFEGIIWIIRTGARWQDMPPPYPSGVTCWRRLKQWEEQGAWRRAWEAVLGMLDERKRIEWDQALIDATFRAAKKGATPLASQSVGRARKRRSLSPARASRWLQSMLRLLLERRASLNRSSSS